MRTPARNRCHTSPRQVHAGDGERLQQRRQIVGRKRGAVQRHARAERASAGANVSFAQRAFLHLRAVNRAGTAGTAVIHDEDVEAVTQRLQQREILLARLRGRESWPPLGRHQRAGRRPRGRVRVVLEIDRHRARYDPFGIQRPHEKPAPGRRCVAVVQRQLPDAQTLRRGRSGSVGVGRRQRHRAQQQAQEHGWAVSKKRHKFEDPTLQQQPAFRARGFDFRKNCVGRNPPRHRTLVGRSYYAGVRCVKHTHVRKAMHSPARHATKEQGRDDPAATGCVSRGASGR